MRWSARSQPGTGNRFATLLARRGEYRDLTVSNPTRCGLGSDVSALLAQPAATTYQPEARGLPIAREAVCRYYQRHGADVDAERVLLCASTSEAYSWLFKLCCDPGDAVLAPRPSYPLFGMLAQLEAVRLVDYPLLRHDEWRIDRGAFERALHEHPVRAVLLVHPANPTGSLVADDDAAWLIEQSRARDFMLIVDEVFIDYAAHAASFTKRSFEGFVLSGLSKVALLPGVKLSWAVYMGGGLGAAHGGALERLDYIADTFLSVATPIQLALPALVERLDELQGPALKRLAHNRDVVHRLTQGTSATLLPSDGGWCALVELPSTQDDMAWATSLAQDHAVLVYPGHLFDIDHGSTVVVSLLAEEDVFEAAVGDLVRAV